jgi:gluconokinase
MNTRGMAIVIMGVAGSGKSTLGPVLAGMLGVPFIEGDGFHSESNRQKMQSGIALTDADRDAWLGALCGQLAQHPDGIVLTCSALKRRYRERLRHARANLHFVFLDLTPEQAAQRAAARRGHFFNTSLVPSQFETLESPTREEAVLTVDATWPVDEIVGRVMKDLAAS